MGSETSIPYKITAISIIKTILIQEHDYIFRKGQFFQNSKIDSFLLFRFIERGVIGLSVINIIKNKRKLSSKTWADPGHVSKDHLCT